MCPREFCCSKQGFKRCSGKIDKVFVKRSSRCNCKARAIFYIEANGEWVCTKHDMIHNHKLFLEDEVHKLRSHKKVKKANVDFSKRWEEMVWKFPCLSASKKWGQGFIILLGFSKRDVYNSLANQVKRTLDGGDANYLMCV